MRNEPTAVGIWESGEKDGVGDLRADRREQGIALRAPDNVVR